MTTKEEDIVYDVIVVGAGISGLSAAYYLKKENEQLRLCILEGRNRIGGRLKAATSKSGKHVDLGGMWVGTQQLQIQELLKELGIETYPQYVNGKNIYDDGYQLNHYVGDIPSISILSLLDADRLLKRIDRISKEMNADDIAKSPEAAKWDSISVASYARKYCWTSQGLKFVSLVVRLVFGYESEQVSMLYFLNDVRAAGGMHQLIDSDGGGQDSRIHGGTIALLTALSDFIIARNGELQFSTPIQSVDYSNAEKLHIRCSTGQNYFCKRVIFAIPPSALSRIQFTPTPSPQKVALWTRSHAGCYIKVVVMYETAFWRDKGFSGSALVESPTKELPISAVFDYCSRGDQHPAFCVFICADSGIDFAALSPEQQRQAVQKHLVRLFGEEANAIVEMYIMDWLHDPDGNIWGGGCPVDVPALGFYRMNYCELKLPMKDNNSTPCVFFAGTETANGWVGYMDGGIEAGKRTCGEVIASLSPGTVVSGK
jgi:monoamine oxidase